MTKRKKRILIVSVSFLSAFVLLFSAFWFIPYPRYLNFNKDVARSDIFLPRPDSVVRMVDGKASYLTEEQIDVMYQAFEKMMADFWYNDSITSHYPEWDKFRYQLNEFCLEFRYNQRQEYTGGEIVTNETIQYDAVLLVFREGFTRGFHPFLYKNGTYSKPTSAYAYVSVCFHNGTDEFRSLVTGM